MQEVVWLASYPRSGNTWVRFLLYRYLHGPIESTARINEVIPGLHGRGRLDHTRPGRTLVKTHFAFAPGHPLSDRAKAVIHIRRHPKDVLLSGLNYHSLTGNSVPALKYANAFIALKGDPVWRQMGFGTWESHIESWLENPALQGIARHWTTYERLKSDTPGELRAMLDFLGESIDEDRLASTVADCTLERLREFEDEEKSKGAPSLFPGSEAARSAGRRFINSGRTGQSLAHIDPGLDAQFDAAFAAILARRGYADSPSAG
ncbi:MAG: sulfotransferase domain-containing protein [Phycisphaeraceae bacterium]|nr:sulfotransferase domain-containing protein [Phycisphaeraceae bacterium]